MALYEDTDTDGQLSVFICSTLPCRKTVSVAFSPEAIRKVGLQMCATMHMCTKPRVRADRSALLHLQHGSGHGQCSMQSAVPAF